MRAYLGLVAALVMLAACGPQGEQAPPPEITASDSEENAAQQAWTPVDPALLGAPSGAFTPIEPSEMGVMAAEEVSQAIEPLTSAELGGEGGAVHVSVRDDGLNKIADVVRTGLMDDSIEAAHVRIEFMPSPEGWFPVSAWRRQQCRRGVNAGAWSAAPCP